MSLQAGEASLNGWDPPQILVTGAGRAPVRLPHRFLVSGLEVVDALVRLTASDARVVVATPGQLAVWSQLLSEQVNPDHHAQAEAEFLDRAARPADDTTDPALRQPVADDMFGPIVPHAPSLSEATAEVADIRRFVSPVPCVPYPVELEFNAMSRSRIGELLPAVHDLLAELPRSWDRALAYLWGQGTDEQRATADPSAFRDAFCLMGVTVYHSGDFGLDLSDASGEFVEDGYWVRINCRADQIPAELLVMS